MSGVGGMRGALLLLICLAASVSTTAAGAVSADTERAATRGAPDRPVPSARQGKLTPGLGRPGEARVAQSATSGAMTAAHAALRQRMLGQVRRPATAAVAPARSAAKSRPLIKAGPMAAGIRGGAYRAVPGHGVLGGPTITRSTPRVLSAKVQSGVPRRPL